MFDVTTFILCTKNTEALINKATGGQPVEIETTTGQLDEDALNKLKESKSALVVLNQKVYRLSRIEETTYKYINLSTSGTSQTLEATELDINTETGHFETKVLILSEVVYNSTTENNNPENN